MIKSPLPLAFNSKYAQREEILEINGQEYDHFNSSADILNGVGITPVD